MRNVTLRSTSKGTAVVLEQVILIHKELFDSYEDAVKYAASLNINEAFRRNRNSNAKKENSPTQSPKTQSS